MRIRMHKMSNFQNKIKSICLICLPYIVHTHHTAFRETMVSPTRSKIFHITDSLLRFATFCLNIGLFPVFHSTLLHTSPHYAQYEVCTMHCQWRRQELKFAGAVAPLLPFLLSLPRPISCPLLSLPFPLSPSPSLLHPFPFSPSLIPYSSHPSPLPFPTPSFPFPLPTAKRLP